MDATEKLIQATFQEVDLFDVEAAVSARDEASHADARASVDSLLDSLTPALRGAVRSGFGLDGVPAISGSKDLLARALSQLRLQQSGVDRAEGVISQRPELPEQAA